MCCVFVRLLRAWRQVCLKKNSPRRNNTCSSRLACRPIYDTEQEFWDIWCPFAPIYTVLWGGVLYFYSIKNSIGLIGTCLKINTYPTYVEAETGTLLLITLSWCSIVVIILATPWCLQPLALMLELSPTDTYIHTRSPKFPIERVPQQVGSAYLLTWDYQYWFLCYVGSSGLQLLELESHCDLLIKSNNIFLSLASATILACDSC